MTPPTEIRCRCVDCLESTKDQEQPGRVWKRKSQTFKAHQALVKANRSIMAGPKKSNASPSLYQSKTVNTGLIVDSANNIGNSLGQQASNHDPGTRKENLQPSTHLAPAEKTMSHLDISYLKKMANPPRRQETGSHFQPKWDGMTVESGQYGRHYYDQFKKFDSKTSAMNLVMVCLYLFEHIGMAFATLCLHVNNSVRGTGDCTTGSSHKGWSPMDIRTVLADLRIQPKIQRTLCCPKCFRLYYEGDTPDICDWRETRSSHKCNERLFKQTKAGEDEENRRANRYFSTVAFTEWLARFLNRPEIEEHLESSKQALGDGSAMHDIWHGYMWRSARGIDGDQFTNSPGNLVFSLNVDWFNPLGNKAAGKQDSVGTVALVCLNLPPHIRTSPENIFLSGLIPGPSEPKMTQINNVLKPLVDELNDLWKGVKFSSTAKYPTQGCIIRVMLGPIICDLPAMRKVLGMAGHSSKKNLCSLCQIGEHNIHLLEIPHALRRCKHELKSQALAWKNAKTVKERQRLFKEHGVRYTVLWELPYFDPTIHTVVEPMHNIFLGLLRHHGLNALGLMSKKKSKSSPQTAGKAEEDDSDTMEEGLEDFDSDDGDSDPEDPEVQGSEYVGDQVVNRSPSACDDATSPPEDDLSLAFGSMALDTLDAEQESRDNQPEPDPFMGFSDEVTGWEDEEEELSDYEEVNEKYNNIFNEKKHLNILREVIGQVHLPSWIGRVPMTVGSSKGGKLKADEWVILYEVMIIPAFILFFHRKGHLSRITDHDIVRNALHLISILKLVRRFELEDRDLEALKYHVKSYRHGLAGMFTSLSVTPNLHMLLHIPQVVRVFGPAPYWTAWSFEATNGSLARIPTNNHDSSREFTILNKWTTGQNMRCVLPDLCKQLPTKTAASLSKFVSPKCTDGSASAYLREGRGGPPTLKYNPKKNETLDYDSHLLLLGRMKEIYGNKCVLSTDIYKKSRYDEDKIPISRFVNQMASVKCRNVVYSTRKRNPGNSIVLYSIHLSKQKKGFVWGKINEIFMTMVRRDGNIDQDIWIDISRYATLSAAHQKKHGFTDWPHSGFSVVYDRKKKKDVIRLDEIVSHGASWENPEGCFGIKEPTLLIVNLSKTSCTAT